MDVRRHLDELTAHGLIMAEALERAGLASAVETCPGWTVLDLLTHTGMVHRWAALNLVEGPDPETGYPRTAVETAPVGDPLEWFRSGHEQLVSTLRAAPVDVVAARFLADAGTPLEFWARRQAHETAIHRADAEAALGTVPQIDTQFALDGIAELLEGFYARRAGRLRTDPGFTLQVTPHESEVSWLVAVRPDGRTITREAHGAEVRADATLSGSAADLYLELWNRPSRGGVEFTGDPAVLATWRELARVSWS
jgi:uncharacterized protein (TIGR03083 family)